MRDADGYIQQVAESAKQSVRKWALFPEEATLDSGLLQIYIIDCPELHPLTTQSLGQHLESKGRADAAEVRCSLHIILIPILIPIRQSNYNYTILHMPLDNYEG